MARFRISLQAETASRSMNWSHPASGMMFCCITLNAIIVDNYFNSLPKPIMAEEAGGSRWITARYNSPLRETPHTSRNGIWYKCVEVRRCPESYFEGKPITACTRCRRTCGARIKKNRKKQGHMKRKKKPGLLQIRCHPISNQAQDLQCAAWSGESLWPLYCPELHFYCRDLYPKQSSDRLCYN
jgi:hypothetical protein